MTALLQDIRFSLRMLRKNPGLTFVVATVLALGIGANTAIFGIVNALLFVPMPYPDPDRIVSITETGERQRNPGPVSYATFLEWKNQSRVFGEMAAFGHSAVNLTGGTGDPERLDAVVVSENACSLLGLKPALGRAFLPADHASNGDRVVLLSHNLWQRRFGGDPGVLGRILTIDGQAYTTVGITLANQKLGMVLGIEPALWLPVTPVSAGDRSARFLALARLGPGITLDRARTDMKIISQRLAEAHPETNRGRAAFVSPLRPEVDALAYVLLSILVGSILGLVCANVTNLLLARSAVREKEMAVRAALGAGRLRLVRQLLTENLLLLSIGCCLGVLGGTWACSLVSKKFVDTNLGLLDIRIDARVVAAMIGLFLLAGTIVGIIPALQISRASLNQPLKEAGTGTCQGRARRRLKSLLVASEFAFSLMLLMGAGLAAKSWHRLWSVDLGFHPEQVLAARISLTSLQYPDGASQAAFYQTLLERIRTRPGIRSAGIASDLPTNSPERAFMLPGRQAFKSEDSPRARFTAVSDGYFTTMTIPLKAGRAFTPRDVAVAAPVAIVNEAMARRYWNGGNPTGGTIEVAGRQLTIVGMTGDVRSIPFSLRPVPEIYVPFAQSPGAGVALTVKTATADPAAVASLVKQEVRAVDPDLPVSKIMTMEKVCLSNMGVIKFGTSALTVIALGALILASVGIYGVLSFLVSQRTREIGIRMALGARPLDVLFLVLKHGLGLTVAGMLPGMAASFVIGRALSSSMYGISPAEPLILAGISMVLLLVAVAACYFPARRAARVDPIESLRSL